MQSPSDFVTHHNVEYDRPSHRGWTSIQVLEFLTGHAWDEVALGYVNALRPSGIRVTTGLQTLDARTWRVTVIVDADNVIKKIKQEVEVGLPERVRHGEALSWALERGVESPECQWFNDDNIEFTSQSPVGLSKVLKDGTSVPFPTGEPNV